MTYLFITFIYQPFLNLLVFIYWMMDFVTGGNADMGVAVIFLTIIIRLLMLPLTLAGNRSEKERRDIAEKVQIIEETFSADPIRKEKEKKKVFKSNRRILIAELFGLTIQVVIALMLWKMFRTGLPGEDLHMIYAFMPEIQQPFNLLFLGQIDLSQTSYLLNAMQAGLIFVLETIAVYSSPFPVTRKEVVRLQLVLPVVAFFIFLYLPAGKKLFVITSLTFSIIFKLTMIIHRKFREYQDQWETGEDEAKEEKIVTEVK
jgi:YidC/Oxa1 family membrane protein insertase